MPFRVMLVDDHQIVLSGLSELLGTRDEIEVVASLRSGRQVQAQVAEVAPDVIVLDVAMPDIDGLDLMRWLAVEAPDVKVVALSMHTELSFIEAMFEAGACAYLAKDCGPEELIEAICEASSGRSFMSRTIVDVIAGRSRSAAPDDRKAYDTLTPREVEVLERLSNGMSTKEIAGELGRSIKTIGTHRESLMQKLNIDSVAGLTKYAIRMAITSPERGAK